MFRPLVMLLLLLILYGGDVSSFPSSMYTRCSLALQVGTTMMGAPTESNNDRVIIVSRASTSESLTQGDYYVPGEIVTVSMDDTSDQYLFETSSGTFQGQASGCNGLRIGNIPIATLIMPDAGAGSVTLRAGWASGFSTVQIPEPITLTEGTAPPTVMPTFMPTEQEVDRSTEGLVISVVLIFFCVFFYLVLS